MSRVGFAAYDCLQAELRTAHLLGRGSQYPQEPASLVAYPAGDEAAFITGDVLAMGRGWKSR